MTFPSHTNRVCWMTLPLANQDIQLSRKGQGWNRMTRWLWRSTAISARLHPLHRRPTKNTFSVLTPTSWLQQGSAFKVSSGDTDFALKESWEKCSQGTHSTCLKGRAGRCSENQIPGIVHRENEQKTLHCHQSLHTTLIYASTLAPHYKGALTYTGILVSTTQHCFNSGHFYMMYIYISKVSKLASATHTNTLHRSF